MLEASVACPQPGLFADLGGADDSASHLLAVAVALLGKAPLKALTAAERALVVSLDLLDERQVSDFRSAILGAGDPLGDAWCRIHAPSQRRAKGQTFSPPRLVDSMVGWASRQAARVTRIVDPGAGTGRFTVAALRQFPHAEAVAVEADPAVAILLRARLHVLGLANRVQVVVDDFRHLSLPANDGATLFIGNPPYVRHHDISPAWKQWYSATLRRLGHKGSQLAGLHLHFFAHTLAMSRAGDLGCYVTSAEWLDVGYGQALRHMLTDGLGGVEVQVLDPTSQVFEDALVSAAITCFAPGTQQGETASLRFHALPLGQGPAGANDGQLVSAEAARAAPRWSGLVRGPAAPTRPGFVALGDMFRVSRGQVTGMNAVWVASARTPPLPPRFLLPSITDASDITRAPEASIDHLDYLRRVIDLPSDLSVLPDRERAQIEAFMAWARRHEADRSYVARHRRAWWAVGLKPPAPMVMTYMGRRPPVFALNPAGARLINVAHEVVPLAPLPQGYLQALVRWLNAHAGRADGRTYAGGLTKFEPSEAMRLSVPGAEIIDAELVAEPGLVPAKAFAA